MNIETEAIVLEGLKRALLEATWNLYRVYTDTSRETGYEERFTKGIDRHMKDYERMVELVVKRA